MVSRHQRGLLRGQTEGVNFGMCYLFFSYKRFGPPRGLNEHEWTLLRSLGRDGALGCCGRSVQIASGYAIRAE